MMLSTNSYYVETAGVRLPDGTVWGAGRDEMMRMVIDPMEPDHYLVYRIIGKSMSLEMRTQRWREMRACIKEFIDYQQSIGNRVFDKMGEIRNFDLLQTEYC